MLHTHRNHSPNFRCKNLKMEKTSESSAGVFRELIIRVFSHVPINATKIEIFAWSLHTI